MLEILPSINCPFKDSDCVRKKIRLTNEFATAIHLDIGDGAFTHHKSWNEPARWKEFSPLAALEVHLMMEQPERSVAAWLEAGAKRIVIHYEAVREPHYRTLWREPSEIFAEMFAACEDASAELALSFNPETPVERAKDYLGLFSSFHILSVYPGLSGQPFLPLNLEKVSRLRRKFPDARIEMDGGMNLETGRLAAEAGADALVVGAYLFGSENPEKTYREMRALG